MPGALCGFFLTRQWEALILGHVDMRWPTFGCAEERPEVSWYNCEGESFASDAASCS
jgi:hypothetical protein